MPPTRTIFFHISPVMQVFFYLLSITSLIVCGWGFVRRVKLWRNGRPFPKIIDWPKRISFLADQMLAHRRIRRRSYAGSMHALIFFGMVALFIGTNIVAVEHYGALIFGAHWLYKGSFYLLCKLLLEIFGAGLLIGTALALFRRYAVKPPSLGQSRFDGAFLLLLFSATLTGFLLEGAGIAADPARQASAAFSPVANLLSAGMHGINSLNYAVIWWIHVPLVLGVIAALPYGRWLHLFVAPITIVTQPERSMGTLEPVTMSQVEDTGRIGLGILGDLSSWELMSFDGCMECGRCTDACPANASGKQLNPKNIVLDMRKLMAEGASASTDVISDESLWACTNCHACVRECPALIRHVDIIDGIRRFRVAEGRLSGPAATALRQLSSRENPWGLPASQRLDWTKGLDIPTVQADVEIEVLFWVGCAGAFEPRAQKTVRAIAQLLQMANVNFAVLGPKERCTGDPARRIGDEFLFQQLAETNITTLNTVKAKKIITQCPHCFHTMKNEYPQFGGNYEVLHHTQYLNELVAEGRLKVPDKLSESVTYHDPCFLARVNGETEAPRSLLNTAIRIPLTEVGKRESKTFCCGAGGGRMWMEDSPSERPGLKRAQELIATGAKTVAVGCPFCKVMVGDSISQVAGDNAPQVMDIAELLLSAVQSDNPGINAA